MANQQPPVDSNPSQSAAPQDRRQHQRAALHIMADITLPGDLTIVGHTMDMSMGGLRAEVPYALESGQECLIELDLTHLGGPSYMRLVSEVRRCSETKSGRFEVGLQFKDMDGEAREVLEALFEG